jgi:hypothetical protein
MIRAPRSSLAALAALVALCSLAHCQRSAEGVCVETLCFSLPLTTSGLRDNGRHTLRPDGAAGWINVQRFVPLERPESTEPHALARALGRRFALASSYGAQGVLSTGVATLLQRQVATVDARVTVGERTLRRRLWLIDATGDEPWLLVDITAPENDFDRALEQLGPIVTNLTKSQR